MGYSTPKAPFDLADFLSQKAKPGSRKPRWRRLAPSAAAKAADAAAGNRPEPAARAEPATADTGSAE
jgi:hypothetical protein